MTKEVLKVAAAAAAGIIAVLVIALWATPARQILDDPASRIVLRPEATDHSNLFKTEKFETGQEVTLACLECHPDAAREVMATQHWNWLGAEEYLPGRDQPVRIGKKNLINNFCISVISNWPKCTSCHAGYGWEDEKFDFTQAKNVDCLVCHDQSGQYVKGAAGQPADDVDLLASAKSVGRPTRDNCGYCHFNGGGGDAVKHGDLDGSLAKPVERVDVHMGRENFDCIICHRTEDHKIPGKMISVSATDTLGLTCNECHTPMPHRSDRLNDHISAVACQSCHIPSMARRTPTKVAWDWSTAGQDVDVEDPHKYLKVKGSFVYAKNLPPEYYWFNGNSDRYLMGDRIDPEKVTHLNYPMGNISDPGAKIFPFKVHRAKQPYDTENNYLLVPKTVGKGGFWDEFDWNKSFELAEELTGLEYSGSYGFAETDMYWLITHMVAPKDDSLQCADCHGESGRMDWAALGYGSDPAFTGGRQFRRILSRAQGGQR